MIPAQLIGRLPERRAQQRLTPSEQLPDEIEGVPVDVIESNPVPNVDVRHSRHDPVLVGINVGNLKVGGPGTGDPGTLGAIVFERGTLRPLALTNWHMAVADPPVTMDQMIQPDPVAPDPEPPNNFLGRLLRWDQGLDAAVSSIGEQDASRSRNVSTDIEGLPLPASVSNPHVVGLKVLKSGLRTGVTGGTIDGTDGTEFSVVPDDFALPQGVLGDHGDSGALWLDRNTFTAVGLHFASISSPEVRAWGKSLSRICDTLNIFVLDVAAIGTPRIDGHCRVLASTRADAPCNLRIVYPSGRTSLVPALAPAAASVERWRGLRSRRLPLNLPYQDGLS